MERCVSGFRGRVLSSFEVFRTISGLYVQNVTIEVVLKVKRGRTLTNQALGFGLVNARKGRGSHCLTVQRELQNY